jgi:hypothetical protein
MDDSSFLGPLVGEVLKYGLAGVVILYLAWKVWSLEKRNAEQQVLLSELYEKRIDEAMKTVVQSTGQTAANERLAELLRAALEKRQNTP